MIKDKDKQDDWLIKLSGKAAVSMPLSVNNNFKVVIQGEITEERKKNRQDGGMIYTWVFEPVLVETINHLGETLKAKDVRKTSQRMRSRSWLYWKDNNINMSDDDFWNWFGTGAIKCFDEIVDLIKEREKLN